MSGDPRTGPPNRAADPLRPERLVDFTGQPRLTGELQILLDAARKRQEPAEHVLLAGPPGLGKTSLAAIIATELAMPIITTSGPALEKIADIISLLSGLTVPSVLFIDEIHRLPRASEEVLYPAMEDGVLDFLIGEGPKARAVRLPLVPFTLIAATTEAGQLSAPLRDRFGFHGRVVPYETEALAVIVGRNAPRVGVDLVVGAAALIASRSRGTPRIANRLLRRVRDVAQLAGDLAMDAAGAQEALSSFGIDTLGLDSLGRDLLRALCVQFSGGPVGGGTLAAAISEAVATLEAYEPYLMRSGLLQRTQRGRVATALAFSHLGLTPGPGTIAALTGSTVLVADPAERRAEQLALGIPAAELDLDLVAAP